MMIVLSDGETLRIRGEFVLSVSRAAGGGATWEIAVKPRGFLARAGRAVLACWLRMHRLGAVQSLAELDPRTLKDIGLEHYLGSVTPPLRRPRA